MRIKGTRPGKKSKAGIPGSGAPAPIISEKFGQPSDFVPPKGPIELKVKWASGSRSVYEVELGQEIETHKEGEVVGAKQDFSMSYRFAFTVASERKESGVEVELEFLNAQLSGVSGGYNWQYDSSNESAGEATQVAELFNKLRSTKIQYRINAANEIERMDGVKELLERLHYRAGATLKAGRTWDDKQLEAVVKRLVSGNNPDKVASLRRMFNPAFFKRLAKIGFYLSPTAVQPGDNWLVQDEYQSSVAKLAQDYKVHFKSWEAHANQTCARLEFQGTEKSKVDPAPKPSWMPISSIEASSSGVIWFAPQLGLSLEACKNVDMRVVHLYAKNPMEAGAQRQSITYRLRQVINNRLVQLE